MDTPTSSGQLFIVATPIGNLADITLRAIEILKTVDIIAAEDTRHSQHLLRHFNITKPLIALHEHNETKNTEKILHLLKEKKSVALLSDAGTPLISDPGQPLVAAAHLAGITVIPLPGACAAITALSATGFPQTEFTFIGFLPSKTTQRQKILTTLTQETRSLIFYEAPHRILETLHDMKNIFGDERRICYARELTKRYETIAIDTMAKIAEQLISHPEQQRGEFVLILESAPVQAKEINQEHLKILSLLLKELPVKTAVQLTSEITGIRKNLLYDLAIKK